MQTWSQELRFTSPTVGGFSWIGGAYFVHTERFISTGNLADRGLGVPAVYQTPLVDPANPFATNTNQTFLADSQNNNAWAVFGDATYAFNPQWEFDAAIRYDEDRRENTTERRPSSCRTRRLSRASDAKTSSARPSPKQPCAISPTTTGPSTAAGAVGSAAVDSTRQVWGRWRARTITGGQRSIQGGSRRHLRSRCQE